MSSKDPISFKVLISSNNVLSRTEKKNKKNSEHPSIPAIPLSIK